MNVKIKPVDWKVGVYVLTEALDTHGERRMDFVAAGCDLIE